MSLDVVLPGDGARLALQIPPNGWQTVPGCLSAGGSARVSAAISLSHRQLLPALSPNTASATCVSCHVVTTELAQLMSAGFWAGASG